MKKFYTYAGMALVAAIVCVAVSVLFALPMMWLWNWLMPDLFSMPTISFAQAWGILVLSGLLFRTSK